jgi:hypothetical protein
LVLDPIDINAWNGIPITSPERTCFGLMARSELVEAVVFADAFGHAGLVTWTGLMRYADERPHWPHVRKARFATDLARFEAASPMETRLRMAIVLPRSNRRQLRAPQQRIERSGYVPTRPEDAGPGALSTGRSYSRFPSRPGEG